MPPHAEKALFGALGELDKTVIMKYDEAIESPPKNVLIKRWLPQQDILAHENVKLFITQGGLLSQIESINRGVPMLVMPCFGDQPFNAARCQRMGFGLTLNWPEVTKEKMLQKIIEITNNSKYAEKAKELGEIFRDNQQKPLDKAMYHMEYIMRYKGAPFLKSPVKKLYWFQRLLLDVLAFSALILFSAIYLVNKISRLKTRKVSSNRCLEGFFAIGIACWLYWVFQ